MMIQIYLNKTDPNIGRFIVNTLKLLPKLCIDHTNKLELEGMVNKIIRETTINYNIRQEIDYKNLEKLNLWYENKEKTLFLRLAKNISLLTTELYKEYLNINELIITKSLQEQIIVLLKISYEYLYEHTEAHDNPIEIIKKIKTYIYNKSLAEV